MNPEFEAYKTVCGITEVHEFSVGGNLLHPEEGCHITMFNSDEEDNEYDSVYIHLSPKQLRNLIRDLSEFLPKEENE